MSILLGIAGSYVAAISFKLLGASELGQTTTSGQVFLINHLCTDRYLHRPERIPHSVIERCEV